MLSRFCEQILLPIFQIKRKIFTLVACFPAHIRCSSELVVCPNSPELRINSLINA